MRMKQVNTLHTWLSFSGVYSSPVLTHSLILRGYFYSGSGGGYSLSFPPNVCVEGERCNRQSLEVLTGDVEEGYYTESG